MSCQSHIEVKSPNVFYLLLKDVMILRSLRHHTEEEVEGYRLHSRLTIHQVSVKVPMKFALRVLHR